MKKKQMGSKVFKIYFEDAAGKKDLQSGIIAASEQDATEKFNLKNPDKTILEIKQSK